MSRLVDRQFLRTVQYRTSANLAARQSIYQFQRPRVDLRAVVLDLARPAGSETVADIGCGNGLYLAELARRGHAGRTLGVDLSAGMLQAARAGVFGTVERHDFPTELEVPGPQPILDYVRSMRLSQNLDDPESLVAATARRLPAGGETVLRVRSRPGCLVCR